MSMFGGFLAPWHVMAKASSTLGYAVLANPLLHITEGLRNALWGGQYIAWQYCVAVLIGYTVLFIVGACYFLKRNIDYV